MFVLNILNVCFPGSRDENKVKFSIFFFVCASGCSCKNFNANITCCKMSVGV